MLESLVIDKIIYIFANDISIENISSMTIVDNRQIKKQDPITVIERKLKCQINTLVLQYGIVETLKKLILFSQSLEMLANDKNATLLSIGSKTLYDRILGYYSPIVYARLVKWFPKLSQGKITAEEIIADIKVIPFNEEFLLGVADPEIGQINLFGDIMDESPNDLAIALNNKNKVKNSAIKAIKNAFDKNEINNLCLNLSDILNSDESLETVIFLRCFLKEMLEIIKENPKRGKGNARQLKIGQF